jgi:hypothetical protein
MTLGIDEFAAQWTLALIPSDDVADLAMQFLADGRDGPALRELASMSPATRADLAPLVTRALRELDAPDLGRREAALLLARRLAAQICRGALAPQEGAARIWRLQIDVPEVGHALHPFVYWASELEGARDEARIAFCSAAICASARSFSARSGS